MNSATRLMIAFLSLSLAGDAFAESYKKCVKKIMKKESELASVVPLEGEVKSLSLEMRGNTKLMNADQAVSLKRVHPRILQCREKIMRAAEGNAEGLILAERTFSAFDKVYLALIEGSLELGRGAEFLHEIRAHARAEDARLTRSQQAREAEAWGRLSKALDTLSKAGEQAPPKAQGAPRYRCHSYSAGGNTYTDCTPRQ